MVKILLTYRDEDGQIGVESIWANIDGEYYRINNIRYFAGNLALNDLVEAREDEGALHFEKLIEASGHSTVQLIIIDGRTQLEVGQEFEALGCS